MSTSKEEAPRSLVPPVKDGPQHEDKYADAIQLLLDGEFHQKRSDAERSSNRPVDWPFAERLESLTPPNDFATIAATVNGTLDISGASITIRVPGNDQLHMRFYSTPNTLGTHVSIETGEKRYSFPHKTGPIVIRDTNSVSFVGGPPEELLVLKLTKDTSSSVRGPRVALLRNPVHQTAVAVASQMRHPVHS